MKKKGAAKVKRTPAKSKKTGTSARLAKRVVQMKPKAPPRPSFKDDPRFQQAVDNYQAGLLAMQEHKFEKAKGLLQKVVAGPSPELADRAAVHLNTCNQNLAGGSTSFKSPEEHYDYAVSLMNGGDYDEARSHLEKLAKQAPTADYVWYGMAVLACLTSRYEDALRHLSEAIRLNPSARYQARNDTDFQNLADDPRFTELLYPEAGVEVPTPPAPENAWESGKRR
jgi:tetratricopeptide (TPR) repeat protein